MNIKLHISIIFLLSPSSFFCMEQNPINDPEFVFEALLESCKTHDNIRNTRKENHSKALKKQRDAENAYKKTFGYYFPCLASKKSLNLKLEMLNAQEEARKARSDLNARIVFLNQLI